MRNIEMNKYEEKQQARRERYEELAAKASNESNSTYKRAKQMAEVIPFGQPILVDHHSAKSDRNYRGRITSTYEKSFKLSEKAKYYEEKASNVGTGGISGDDPEAIQKLQAKLKERTDHQEFMKKVNALIRKNDDAGLKQLGLSDENIEEVKAPDYCGRIGYASYQLSNNLGTIKAIERRIAELQAAQSYTFADVEGDGWKCTLDKEDNRFVFEFDGIPPEETRNLLKKNAFKWSRYRKAWVRKFTGNALFAIKRIVLPALQKAAS